VKILQFQYVPENKHIRERVYALCDDGKVYWRFAYPTGSWSKWEESDEFKFEAAPDQPAEQGETT